MSWSEPPAWHRTAMRIARSERPSRFPWVTWLLLLLMFSVVIVLEWRDADPTVRASIPKLVSIVAVGFGFFLGMGRLYVRFNRTKGTTIHEGGIVHGSMLKKQWIPWSDIEYFYIEDDGIDDLTFKFLTWKKLDEEDEAYSVLPESVNVSSVVRWFESNQVEPRRDNPYQPFSFDDFP